MKEIKLITKSRQETQDLAEKLGSRIYKPLTIIMEGDLGAGKTTFTQGLAKGLAISETVNSPTFTILKIYEGRLPLYHIDAYRLEGIKQDLGFEEYINTDGVCVIEWAKYVEYLLPEKYLKLEIFNGDDNERILVFTNHGEDEKYLEDLC